jgi:hypothetical protein
LRSDSFLFNKDHITQAFSDEDTIQQMGVEEIWGEPSLSSLHNIVYLRS